MNITLSAYQNELVRQFEAAIASSEKGLEAAHAALSATPGEWTMDGSIARWNISTSQNELKAGRAAVAMLVVMSHDETVECFDELADMYHAAGGRDELTTVEAFMAPVTMQELEAV